MSKLTLMIPLLAALGAIALPQAHAETTECPSYLNTELRRLHSQETVNLCQYYQAGKPMVIVNTASHCGFTKQFGGLEKLHQKYKDEGLVILGFPSNSFNQEEKLEEGTARVCYKNYGVSFPMFEHVDVKGKDAHPLFAYLTKQSEAPSWNFNKYLIDNDKVVHFGSKVAPEGSELEKAVSGALAKTAVKNAL
ncbi:MAG: glutathione peroxidase [Cellvibrionaceae bacterium]|nr:glutathione peroxidase [Cellvibrionaceae bacterium]